MRQMFKSKNTTSKYLAISKPIAEYFSDLFMQYSIKNILTFGLIGNLCVLSTLLFRQVMQPNYSLNHDLRTSINPETLFSAQQSVYEDPRISLLRAELSTSQAVRKQNKIQLIEVRANEIDKIKLSQNLKAEIKKTLPLLGKTNTKARLSIYHSKGALESVGLINSKGIEYKKILCYNKGFYDSKGVRLDKKPHMLKLVEIVKSNNPEKTSRITSGFGYRKDPFSKKIKFHTGVDVAGPIKSPVRAALSGKIKTAGFNKGYGNYIVLNHGNKLETLYAHLHSFEPTAIIGKEIKQGQAIGRLGRTGRATGPHVHFETIQNGKPIDPKLVKLKPMSLPKSQMQWFNNKVKELSRIRAEFVDLKDRFKS